MSPRSRIGGYDDGVAILLGNEERRRSRGRSWPVRTQCCWAKKRKRGSCVRGGRRRRLWIPGEVSEEPGTLRAVGDEDDGVGRIRER